jgi:hypothetical protein
MASCGTGGDFSCVIVARDGMLRGGHQELSGIAPKFVRAENIRMNDDVRGCEVLTWIEVVWACLASSVCCCRGCLAVGLFVVWQ